MAKILIIHFSTISNVAQTIPTVYSLAAQYPQHEVMVLSQDILAPLFENLPDNVIFRGMDLRGEHAGLMGLTSLYSELKEEHFHAVIDCQDTFRSKYLRWRFKLSGVQTACTDKRSLDEALRCMGYPVQPDFVSLFGNHKGNIRNLQAMTGYKSNDKWIGIVPSLPLLRGRIHPLPESEEMVERLSARRGVKVFLFGNGRKEQKQLEQWEKRFPGLVSTAGKLTLRTELALMSHLDVLLSADSLRAQLASLVNIPVITDMASPAVMRQIEHITRLNPETKA